MSKAANFVAISQNSPAIIHPRRCFKTNVLDTQSPCEAAKRDKISRFYPVSTYEKYGDLCFESTEKYSASYPCRLFASYNAPTTSWDYVVRAYSYICEFYVTITTCSNDYSFYQIPEKVIPAFIPKAPSNEDFPLFSSAANAQTLQDVSYGYIAIDKFISNETMGEICE
jgi:dTDP-glucose 4,6-dehydratase